MSDAHFRDDAWFKSSYCGDGGCVGVAITPSAIGVRDTKDQGKGPILSFDASEWSSFVGAAVRGEFTVDGLGL